MFTYKPELSNRNLLGSGFFNYTVMKSLIIILSFLFVNSAYSQISVGHSFEFWGQTAKIIEMSYKIDRFSVHYFHNYEPEYFYRGNDLRQSRNNSSFAFSGRAFQSKYFNFGGIVSNNKFPTTVSTRLNFLLELKIPIKRFELSYGHISNGFGLIHGDNPGYDSIRLYIKL